MSHTSKKCRKIWQFIGIFMLTCVVSVLPASLAGAQRATKSTVAPVSYTHLDVYKRQIRNRFLKHGYEKRVSGYGTDACNSQ